jgi:SPP1 gp7 family putative phage head morphogenesis protein
MPLKTCEINGAAGWQWGDAGTCYPGPAGRRRALQQAAAIKANTPATNAAGGATAATQADLTAPAVGRRPNPLALDPTRTTMLRRRYMAEMGKRFRALRGAIRKKLVTDDALGLRTPGSLQFNALTTNAPVWIFLTDAQKLAAFQAWFVQQVQQGILAPAPGADPSTPWMTPYVDSAYMQGVQRAYTETHAEAMAEGLPDAIYEGGQEAFLASSFSGQVATSKVELLATRNFEQLKGVTAAMGQQVNRVLSDGLVAGHSPTKIAKAMNEQIDGMTKKRAMTIARTEIIHAHAEGQLDSFDAMNVEQVGALAEWATAGDGKVCPVCAPLEGAILTIKEARGLIPRHPNCRCMWLPAGVGEETTGQTWAKDIIDFDFRNSMKQETGQTDGKKARAASKWQGASKKITDKGKLKPTKKNKAAKAAKLDAAAKAKAAKAAAALEIKKAKAAEEAAAAKAKAAEVAAAAAKAKADAAALHADKLKAGEAKTKAKARWGLSEDDFALDSKGVAVMTQTGQAKIDKAKAKTAHSKKVKQGMAKSHFTKKVGVDPAHIAEGKLTPPGKLAALKAKGFEGFGDPLLTVGKAKTPAEQAAYDAGQEFLGAQTLTAQKTAYDKIKHPLYKAIPTPAPENKNLAKALAKSHINHRATGEADFTTLDGWGGDGPKSYGGVVVDSRGRVLLREPKGHFDGYAWTFPKGGVEGGDNPLQTALKEVTEETGHKGRTVGYLPGAFKGGTSDVHMFLMKSEGFDSSKMDAETKGLRWVTKEEAAKLIGKSKNKAGQKRDLAILDAAYKEIDFMGSVGGDGIGPVQVEPTVGASPVAGHFEHAVTKGKAAKAKKPSWLQKKKAAEAKSYFTQELGISPAHIKTSEFDPGAPEKLMPPGKLVAIQAKGFTGWGDDLLNPEAAPETEAEQVLWDAQNEFLSAKTLAAQKKAYDKIEHPGVQAKGAFPAVAAETKARAKAARTTAPSAVPGTKTAAFPDDAGDLRYVQTLSGSTAPQLKIDDDGKQWVVKETGGKLSAPHIRSELLADKLYADLGISVPAGTMLETSTGPQKVTEFLEGGTTLEDWRRGKTPAELKAMNKQIQKGFVADALFANHDVAGMTFDNIFIVDGKPVRIDNGGALLYRAQGQAKADFGPVVAELKSLRDSKYKISELYEGITDDEIHDQIRHIVANREKLLATVMAQEGNMPRKLLRLGIDERITHLEGLLPPDKPKPKPKRKRAKAKAKAAGTAPIREINEAAVKRVRNSRSNGVTMAADERDIEDNSVLVWEQKTGAGDPVTRVSLKMTDDGNAKVEAVLGAAMREADTANTLQTAGSQKPEPTYDTDKQFNIHGSIEKAYKTANTHADDGKYNTETVEGLEATAEILQDFMKYEVGDLVSAKKDGKWATHTITTDDKAMASYYMPHVETVSDLMDTQTKPQAMMRPYVDPKAKKRAAKLREQAPADATPLTGAKLRFQPVSRVPGTFKKGNAQEMQDPSYPRNTLPGEEYQIDLGGGVTATYMPRRAGTKQRRGLAIEGTLELTLPGPVSVARMREINNIINGLDIDPAPPSPAFEESVYINRALRQRMARKSQGDDHVGGWAEYESIWDNTSLTETERVKRQKAWVKKRMGIELPAAGETSEWYNPTGQSMTSAGDGSRTWVSWLRTPGEVAETLPMEKYVIQQTIGSLSNSQLDAIPKVVGLVLESGGEMASTTTRLRKGVPIYDAGGYSIGDSPESDINSGGGAYAFTRVMTAEASGNVQGIFYKVRNVRRADTTHYKGDVYGKIAEAATGANTTLGNIKDKAGQADGRYGSNELVLKNGLSLIDEIDVIRVHNTRERRSVIDKFKEAKIEVLPDGRRVEDIVLVRGQAFNEADRNYEAYSFEEKGQAETVGQTPRERDYTHTPVKPKAKKRN